MGQNFNHVTKHVQLRYYQYRSWTCSIRCIVSFYFNFLMKLCCLGAMYRYVVIFVAARLHAALLWGPVQSPFCSINSMNYWRYISSRSWHAQAQGASVDPARMRTRSVVRAAEFVMIYTVDFLIICRTWSSTLQTLSFNVSHSNGMK